MKKKNFAAIAVALVTGGLSAKAARAGLFSPAIQNPGFEYDIVNNPNSLGYDYQLNQWYRVSGGEEWIAQSHIPVANDSAGSTAYAMLMGSTGRGPSVATNGEIFQQIGTVDANTPITVNFSEAYLSGAVKGLTVSLFSGGSPVNTFAGYTGGYNTYGPTYALTGATLLGSQTFADSGAAKVFQNTSATINTGTTGTVGSSLWLAFTFNSTAAYTDEVALDDVSVTEGSVFITPVLTWTGANLSAGWNTSAVNFNNSSNVAATYNDSAAVIFDDRAVSGIINLNTSNVSPVSVTFNNSSKSYVLQGNYGIAGTGSLTKNGTGTLTISNTNTFSGPLALNAGVINLQNANGLGTGGITVASGATLQLQNSITVPSALPVTISGTGAAGQAGALVSLSGNNVISGATMLGNSTISVNAGSLTVSGEISGPYGLTKVGAGTLTFGSSSTYTGDTTVNAGTLVLTTGGSSGAIRSTNLNINPGATVSTTPTGGDALGYGGPGYSVFNVNIIGGTFDNAASSNEGYDTAWNLTGGSITSSGGGAINIDAGATAGYGFTSFASSTESLISAPITIRSGNLVFNVAQGSVPTGIDLAVTGAIKDGGSGYSIDKEGSGTLDLTGSNTYTGGITVNGGTLMFGDGTAGHDGSVAAANTLTDNASVVYDTNASQTFGGSIQGTGSVTKIGPGTLTLSGSLNYSGVTNVSAGKLYVTGGLGGGTGVTVGSSGTLGGNASINEAVTVLPGGSIEGGLAGSGQLTVAGLAFNGSGSVFVSNLANYSGGSAVYVNGTLSTAATNSVSINVLSLAGATTGTAYDVIGYFAESGIGIGAFKVSLPRGDVGTLSDTGNQIDLTLSSIGGAYNLLWTGAGNAANGWDTSSSNWNYNGAATQYIDSPGDPVLFDDTPGANQTIAIKSGDVHPNAVTFNNSTYTYTITGPNAIAGTTALTVNGTGKVILENSNTYTGGTVINSGTLQLGSGVTGQDGTISSVGGVSIAAGGTLAFDESTAKTFAAVISGAGNVTVSGPGAITLTAPQNTDTGTLTLNAGATVTLAPAVTATPGYETQDFSSITVGTGATLNLSTVHTFGYAGGTRSAITINGGTLFNLGNDNYVGAVTMTSGTIGGTGELRLQNNLGATASTLTTLPSSTTDTVNVSSFALVGYYGNPVIFNISQGTTASGIDLLITSNVDSSAALDKIGAGTMELTGTSTYTGGTNVGGGTLIFASSKAFPASLPLTITTGGLVVAASHTSAVKNDIVALGLSFSGSTDAWTGQLDLKNNDMIVRGSSFTETIGTTTYPGTASVGDITDQVKEGYNGAGGGNWQGSGGITSSTAAADTTHLHALGVVLNDNGTGSSTALYTTFDGTTTAEGDVLVKYTYYGDANLDGKVDGSDYSRIDNGFLNGLTGWFNGDFNYDGVIDGSDYTLIDNAYNTQGAVISAEVASATAQIAGATSAVPEPASLGLLGMGAIGLLGRRRRKS